LGSPLEPAAKHAAPIAKAKNVMKPKRITPRSELMQSRVKNNEALLDSLKEDKHSAFLLEEMRSDAKLGRMTQPMLAHKADLSKILLARRFSREQGVKDDGSIKLRAVDDETGCGLNGATDPTEKLHNEHIDMLLQITALTWKQTGVAPSFWKADIDSAFRRVPIAVGDRDLVWVAIKHEGQIWIARHNSACFGATASVHAWNRVGALLAHIARVWLKLPVLRYVDDYFSCDREENVKHALGCFASLCRILMGDDALKDKKMESGNPIGILGLRVTADETSVHVWPEPKKVTNWAKDIDEAISKQKLSSADASKLAGRLSWAAQHTFMRIGCAPLRPIFTQVNKPLPGDRITNLLRDALIWWREYLRLPLKMTHYYGRAPECVHIFTDARSTPPRIAATMLLEGKLYYSDAEPSTEVVKQLLNRKDQQIMALEMLAAFFGIATFAPFLKGKCIHVYIDNTAGEKAIDKGAAKSQDHNMITHHLRLLAAEVGAGLVIHRVPSKLNLADLPSREEYEGLAAHGAVRIEPIQPPLAADWINNYYPSSKQQPSKPTSRRQQQRRRASSRKPTGQGT
jgi:hypothetical protein